MKIPRKQTALLAALGVGGLLLAGCASSGYGGYGGYGGRYYAPYSSNYGPSTVYRGGYGYGAHRGGYVGGGFGLFGGGHRSGFGGHGGGFGRH